MHVTVYGIPNCDTVRKARAWLQAHGVEHEFHDFRRAGVPADRLQAWCDAHGWERLLNRQGTTWRKLPPAEQSRASDAAGAQRLMCEQPSLIRRPVVEWPGQTSVGFDEAAWSRWAAGG